MLPAVFDLVDRRLIWADLALEARPHWNNVATNLSGVSLMLRSLLEMKKPTLHARARGSLVPTAEEAQTVFAVQTGITPFDVNRIASEFL